jgi:hypothetical protein
MQTTDGANSLKSLVAGSYNISKCKINYRCTASYGAQKSTTSGMTINNGCLE